MNYLHKLSCALNRLEFVTVSLLLLSSAVKAQEATNRGKPRDIPISFVTSDSLELHAWLTPTNSKDEAPLLITLPMRGHTHSSYEPFIEKVFEYFAKDSTGRPRPYILNIDLRGHGESRSIGERTIDYRDMSHDQYRKMPEDVAELARFLMADSNYHISSKGVMIVGASIGANTSVMAADMIPGTERVVMLSPGMDYLGLTPETATKNSKSAILIYAGKKDSYAFSSSKQLAKAGGNNVKLVQFDSGDHGTNIIGNSEKGMRELIEWLFRP